jgi:hypothetical protein
MLFSAKELESSRKRQIKEVLTHEEVDILGAVDTPQPFSNTFLIPVSGSELAQYVKSLLNVSLPYRGWGIVVLRELGLGGTGKEAMVLSGGLLYAITSNVGAVSRGWRPRGEESHFSVWC